MRATSTAMLADAAWAQVLVSQGRGSDLPLCVALDVYGVVPVLRDGSSRRERR